MSSVRPAAPSEPTGRDAGVLAGLFVAVFTALVAGEAHVENDVFWHLAIGREVLTHGFPRTDPFAFSTDAIAWSPPEWLSEVLMFEVHRGLGLGGLALVRLALLVGLGALLWSRARLLTATPRAALLALSVAAIPASVHLPMRPLLLGHLLFALVLDQLARMRAGRRHAVALLPLVFVLWANTHPSWPVGLAFVALALVAGVGVERLGLGARLGLGRSMLSTQDARELGIAFAFSCVAPLARPDGLDGALYPFVHLVGLGAEASEIIEWFPLSWDRPLHVVTVLGLGLVLIGLVRARARRDAFDVLVVALVTILALGAQRFLPLVTIAVGPIAAALASEHPRLRGGLTSQGMQRGALAVAVVLGLLAVPGGGALEAEVDDAYPRGAVRFIEEHGLPERTFNTFETGGYLLWQLPERRVYLDSRFDLYARAGVFREYLRLRRGEDVLALLDARAIDAALLPTPELDENFQSMDATLRAAGWREAFADELAVVLVRPGAPEPH